MADPDPARGPRRRDPAWQRRREAVHRTMPAIGSSARLRGRRRATLRPLGLPSARCCIGWSDGDASGPNSTRSTVRRAAFEPLQTLGRSAFRPHSGPESTIGTGGFLPVGFRARVRARGSGRCGRARSLSYTRNRNVGLRAAWCIRGLRPERAVVSSKMPTAAGILASRHSHS